MCVCMCVCMCVYKGSCRTLHARMTFMLCAWVRVGPDVYFHIGPLCVSVVAALCLLDGKLCLKYFSLCTC